MLAAQAPAGLEETVFAHVKDLVARKVVRNDRLALGVMSFDGKGTWSRADGPKVEGARGSRRTTPPARPCRRSARSARR